MPQKLADFTLPLAVILLAPSLPVKSVARPPEGVSGKIVLDEVADGLRRYQAEKDEGKVCLDILKRLAPTRDPRVGMALAYRFDTGKRLQIHRRGDNLDQVSQLLEEYFLPPHSYAATPPPTMMGRARGTSGRPDVVISNVGSLLDEHQYAVRDWLEKNGGDLNRRAKHLPQ